MREQLEPLKNKLNEDNINEGDLDDNESFCYVENYFLKEDVKGAVAWLKKQKLFISDMKINCGRCNEESLIFRKEDDICLKCTIDEAFEDAIR